MKIRSIILIVFSLMLVSGCIKNRMKLPEPPPPPPPPKAPSLDYSDTKKYSYRSRTDPPVSRTRYEGSLWQDESSWGNLLRDHRARFKNDVITITGLPEIIVVPNKKDKAAAAPVAATPLAQAGEAQAAQLAGAISAVSEAIGKVDEEEEQNDVLRSLKTISARVTSVLPNGNMVILGEKIDYRQQNSIRYVTKITGIIRPEDVTEKNEVTSLRLARSEVQIKRQVLASKLKLNALSPLLGRQKAGLLDKISHIMTPTKRRQTSKVNTK